jgi:hypothetical protein
MATMRQMDFLSVVSEIINKIKRFSDCSFKEQLFICSSVQFPLIEELSLLL